MRSLFALLAAAFMALAMPAHAETRWTGIYIGAHGGLDLSSTKVSVPGLASIDALSGSGHAYGIHGGFDHQIPGTKLIVGIGADYTWSDSDFTVRGTGLPTAVRAGIDESWAIFGRLGYDMGRAMPYVLAGYTEADASASILGSGVGTTTLSGWLIGGGVELALDGGLFIGAEYRYAMFDTEKLIPGVLHLDTDRHEVRATLRYRLSPF